MSLDTPDTCATQSGGYKFPDDVFSGDRTQEAYLRLEQQISEPDENGLRYYLGRHVIGRDTPINGGVYLGGCAREALVVDDKKYPLELNQTYHHLTSLLGHQKIESALVKEMLEAVFETVQELLPTDQETTGEFVEIFLEAHGNDTKIPLNIFIKYRIGVCRHQALLAAYLIERLIKEGKVNGRVSVDRNAHTYIGAHAWARYTEENGPVWILDTTLLGRVYRLDKMEEILWNYMRPEDKISPELTAQDMVVLTRDWNAQVTADLIELMEEKKRPNYQSVVKQLHNQHPQQPRFSAEECILEMANIRRNIRKIWRDMMKRHAIKRITKETPVEQAIEDVQKETYVRFTEKYLREIREFHTP